MPRYFAIQPPSDDAARTFAAADRITAQMHHIAAALNVRIVAVRPRTNIGYVCAISARRPIREEAIVSKLRAEPRLRGYRISMEAESVDGPFDWREEKQS